MDDVDGVPAGDIDEDEAAILINAIVAPVASPSNYFENDNDNVTCAICHLDLPPNSRAKYNWVACGICRTWFHNICVGLGKRKVTSFKCMNC